MRGDTLQFTMIAALVLGTSGCGTLLSNFVGFSTGSPPIEVYGGVRFDAEAVNDYIVIPVTEVFADDDPAEFLRRMPSAAFNLQMVAFSLGLLHIVDMPFSAIADTALLPWTIPNSINNRHSVTTTDPNVEIQMSKEIRMTKIQ